MALSKGLKANHVMRCLDLNIPPDNEEFAKICRDILNTCVRNTEEAERAAHGVSPDGGSNGMPTSGKGLRRGVWGLIEESELAKSIRQGDGCKTDTISRAQALLAQIEDHSSTPRTEVNPSGAEQELIQEAREMVEELTAQIQSTAVDETKLEELLGLCDKLNTGIDRLSSRTSSKSLLLGLGLKVDCLNGTSGDVLHDSPKGDEENEEADGLLTPRVDKGKGRAQPEPEVPEKVLSPTFTITESEDEDEDDHRFMDVEEGGEPEQATSPTDRSKSWVAEEGEVFRKGAVLLGPEEMEGEYPGEELRRELLEAMVERPPPRGIIIDEFGTELSVQTAPLEEAPHSPPATEEPQPQKLPPKPYISRNRSTSSNSLQTVSDIQSPISPTAKTPTSPPPTSPGGTSRAFPLRS